MCTFKPYIKFPLFLLFLAHPTALPLAEGLPLFGCQRLTQYRPLFQPLYHSLIYSRLFVSIKLCFSTVDTVGTGAAEIGIFPVRISAVPSTAHIPPQFLQEDGRIPSRLTHECSVPKSLHVVIRCCAASAVRNANHRTALSVHHITSDQQSCRCGLLIRTNQRGITSICAPSLTIRGQNMNLH